MAINLCCMVIISVWAANDNLPEVIVRADDTVITKSCRVVIPPGLIIADKNDNGVIQIAASDVVVEFAEGVVLRGTKEGIPPDEYQGYGIRVNGQTGVTIRKANIHGYRCAIWATRADGLIVEDADASDARRARLRSTPSAEDEEDWLSPHYNDKEEWLKSYGSAIYVEDSARATIRQCRVRDSQNGLCLDRVKDSKVYDNDFSFLSGWGIALWRSSHNVISRNAVDFCVRGYSYGVYNRGQDSAGFLVFEQCNDNIFAENSATHGGDGFFGFAGREALGEAAAPTPDFTYARRGNNNNVLIDNDFSYAAAHGIETTFSFGNRLIGNRLVGNAICGIWGGYSQETLIEGNVIEDNGDEGYGMERGGINIEHGRRNRIVRNKFAENQCAVHLWWDEDAETAKSPWAKANGTESTDNIIAGNTFDRDAIALQFRGRGDVIMGSNEFTGINREVETAVDYKVKRDDDLKAEPSPEPTYPVDGKTHPVGARKNLQGRENIVMTEWGPWDHETPLIRLVEATGASDTYDMHKLPEPPRVTLMGTGVGGHMISGKIGEMPRYAVSSGEPGVHPYTLTISAGDFRKTIKGTLVGATWNVAFFNWPKETDPREHLEDWRKLSQNVWAASLKSDKLTFRFGMGGPSDLKLSQEVVKAKIGPDHFGMIAKTTLPLPKGKWKFATLSDDGVRVMVNGKALIDDWNWHAPKRDEAVYETSSAEEVDIVVEYFEIDGYAVLEFCLTPES